MSGKSVLHTGGCQCGAVRYAIYGKPVTSSVCHCRMCQKAMGAFFAAFAGFNNSDFTWTRGTPKLFRSSDEVQRGFCAECGTPLSFEFDGAGKTSLALGSLDDPESIAPYDQMQSASAVSYVPKFSHLPERIDTGKYAEILENIAETNRQHPDHDTGQWPPVKAARDDRGQE